MKMHQEGQLLLRIFDRAGVSGDLYTSHSLRRGFATWAAAKGWDIKTLMTTSAGRT
jgi:integrase